MNNKRNKIKFLEIWDSVLFPQAQKLCNECSDILVIPENRAKSTCWKAYKAFNKQCSYNYMSNPKAPLDRHKVAACYTYAVVAARILQVRPSAPDNMMTNLVNERLAITVGCSVLAGYTYETVKNMEDLSVERKASLLSFVEQGVRFPGKNMVSHGCYLDDVLRYLGFTYAEQNYNILLLGLLYYEWEKTLLPDDESRKMLMRVRPGEYAHTPKI